MSRFIVFEGIDGSGKSTQIKKLARFLESMGISLMTTREPTDGHMGKLLRSYLKKEKETDPRAIALLFAADRIDHITAPDGIAAALTEGRWVLCDRYYLSSYAYHSVDCDLGWVVDVNRIAQKYAKPDLHIFIDLPAEVSMERVKARGECELYEQIERQQRTRECFLRVIEEMGDEENILIVDGTRDPDTIAQEIAEKVKELV